jgi:hypothetical protein
MRIGQFRYQRGVRRQETAGPRACAYGRILDVRRVGIDQDGFIEREGNLALIPRAFAPVVDMTKAAILGSFSDDSLHSAYLHGSIPRGTAVPGVSDLDVLLALHDEPSQADLSTAAGLEARTPSVLTGPRPGRPSAGH